MFILSSVERTSWEERLVRYERTDMVLLKLINMASYCHRTQW